MKTKYLYVPRTNNKLTNLNMMYDLFDKQVIAYYYIAARPDEALTDMDCYMIADNGVLVPFRK